MAKLSFLLGLAGAVLSEAQAESGHDVSALVQGSVRAHRADAAGEVTVGSRVVETAEGPIANTRLGPIKGLAMEDHYLYSGIRFVEQPERFEVGKPLKPWAPKVYEATRFMPACIGAEVNEPESEDCLHLNIWIPKSGLTNLPVIVYFHGGINQHGSGSETLRRGDTIVLSEKYPSIFVNFNFRLGIFGWISLDGSNITNNLGLLDQQAALRWVQENIAAFGGDPKRVTLQGQSEGGGIILTHMTAPGSRGLFHRCVLHSPILDFWSRRTNPLRTKFMVREAGCKRKSPESIVQCLKKKTAADLWAKDWVSEELSRPASPKYLSNFLNLGKFFLQANDKQDIPGELGWHPIVDGATILDEPREMIVQGKFHKVPLLVTVSKNETYGCLSDGSPVAAGWGLGYTLAPNAKKNITSAYARSLAAQGIRNVPETELINQVLTDKLFTCDARSLCKDIVEGGGQVRLGMFWHSPKVDPVGRMTSKVCEHGATCHAAEMTYVLPQRKGTDFAGKGLEGEKAFSDRYRDSFLAFVHGKDSEHPWKAWDSTEPITFYDHTGSWVVPGYRREQCDILDTSVGSRLPAYLHRRAARASAPAAAELAYSAGASRV